MVSIERTHSGRYRVRWRNRSGSQVQRSCPNRATAAQLAREVEIALALGRDWEPAAPRPKAPKLRDVAEVYIAHVARSRAPGTGEDYARKVGRFLQHVGGDTPTTDLDVEVIEKYHDALRAAGNLVPYTIHQHLRAALRFWRWAWESGRWEERLPSGHLVSQIPRPAQYELQRLPPRVPRAPTWAQSAAMIQHLGTRAPWHRQACALMYYTGMRPSAAFQLDWADIDLGDAWLLLRPENTKGGYGGRKIPISAHLVEEMAAWSDRSGLVIPRTKPWRGKSSNLNEATIRAWGRAQIPERARRGQSLKAFRKGMRTGLKAARVDETTIDYLLGHKGQGVGVRSYLDPELGIWDTAVEAVATIPSIEAAARKWRPPAPE